MITAVIPLKFPKILSRLTNGFYASIVNRIPVLRSKKTKLVWYSPKWSTNPKRWWVLRKYVISTGPLLRIGFATLVVVIGIIAYLKIAFPGIALPNLWPIVFALPAAIGALVLQIGLLSLFRQRVLVTPRKILIAHGQSATIIQPESLTCVTLTVHDDEKSRIRFDYSVKSKNRFKTVGLSEDCDLVKLSELLPIEIVTRDVRRNIAG